MINTTSAVQYPAVQDEWLEPKRPRAGLQPVPD